MLNQKYGVVYTPNSLAIFVASLLDRFSENKLKENAIILDPSSGECALLRAAKKILGESNKFFGIDIDPDVINETRKEFDIIHNDTIIPKNTKRTAESYWKTIFHDVDAIIANPPWSSQKIYKKEELIKAGYSFIEGQYDSYVLFIELSYKLLKEGGIMAFIIPDSIFDSQNKSLRKFLIKNTQIKAIARLGEKLFEEVNRATTVIVCQKSTPNTDTMTECFRLSTENRKIYLKENYSLLSFYCKDVHKVSQSRFANNNDYLFDVDTKDYEEKLLKKITDQSIEWEKEFTFGRGVEISKSGKIVYCPHCSMAQGYSKQHLNTGYKICLHCRKKIPITPNTISNVITDNKENGTKPIYVGEHIHRYITNGNSYIKENVEGINYKTSGLYDSPKILIRKTGLGIYATIDYLGRYTSQTVYILKNITQKHVPLEYYLALINSRVVYYYYLKTYGENEWKSHPYLTKQIIFNLPLKQYIGDDIDSQIVNCSKTLIKNYNRAVDLQLEKLIMKKYRLDFEEQEIISKEINNLPNLSAINNMKIQVI